MSIVFNALGFTNVNGYNVTEVFDNTHIGHFNPGDTFSAWVNPTGIFLGKAIAV